MNITTGGVQAMKTRLIIIATAASLLAATAAATPVCLERTNFATPTSRYFFSDAGDTVTDRATGLIWQRCLLGQTFQDGGTPFVYQDDTCSDTPNAARSWSAALQGAVDYNSEQAAAGQPAGWRVPNRKELATIEELRCTLPALNPIVFPSVPAETLLWASTPLLDATSTSAWVLDTWNGGLTTAAKTGANRVRLVRDP
jgi:uncharacterized protein DUF1566